MRPIDADATLDLLKSLGNRKYRRSKGTIAEAEKMLAYEEYTPTLDVEPVRHAHWIIEKTPTGSEYTRCSKCNLDYSWNDRKYGLHKLDMRGSGFCPNCGAKMDEDSENEYLKLFFTRGGKLASLKKMEEGRA